MLLQRTKPTNYNYLSKLAIHNYHLKASFTSLPQRPLSSSLDSVTYTKLIQSSTKSGSLIHGKLCHTHIIKTSFKPCLFLVNNLLNMYCKYGEIHFAYQLFDKMPKRNVVSYNLLISRCLLMGFYDEAINLFNEARMEGLKLDKFTYAGAISVCGHTQDLERGKLVHGMVVVGGLNRQVFVTNSLIDMYCKCGEVDQARLLFERSCELDGVSWNSLISGYVRVGVIEEAFRLFVKMHQYGLNLNTYTLGCVLNACSTNFDDSAKYGRMLHGCTVKLGLGLDVVVATALLDMYAKTRNLDDAIRIFEFFPNKNVVMYNAMIAGFMQTDILSDDCANLAFKLFSEMQMQGMKPSKFTFSSIIKACNVVEAFKHGRQIHAGIYKSNLQSDEFIGSALVEFYSSFGSTQDALKCFKLAPKLDIVSWTSMISGLVRNGQFESALSLFLELLASGVKADEFIISTVLVACADLYATRFGEQVQGYSIKSGIWNFTIVQNSQICTYAKSGDINSANSTFEEIKNPDMVSWSAMICSKAQHGYAGDALKLFELMKDFGVAPNQITFLGVLTACSHGGLVEEGLHYFASMNEDHGLVANVEHYACAVDLLARTGRLADAENFILSSGFEGSPVMWRALLSGCRVYKDTIMGRRIAEKLIELEPDAAASYVLLSSICSDAGIELPAAKVRELMKERGIRKKPGLSWVQSRNRVSSFVVGDKFNPMNQMIYARLENKLLENETK